MLSNARLGGRSLKELIECRDALLKEFWYGYRLWYLPQYRPTFGSKTYYTILRVEEIWRIVLVYELYIALYDDEE